MKKQFIVVLVALVVLSACSDTKTKETKESKTVDLTTYTKKGAEIAKATQMQLGKNLKGTMKAKGAVAAVAFCNAKAMPLTSEMEKKYDAKIKRVSNKLRNGANKANDVEAKVIANYINALKDGTELKPITELDGDKVHYYAPIKVGGVCITCHGETIAKPIDSILKLKYPNDKAIGYHEGELRGIWSITMNK